MDSNHHPVNKYGMDAIGKKVLVEHPGEGGKSAWFQGHVREWNDGKHRIVFTSEKDHAWGNLETWERDNTLVWIRTDYVQEEIANISVGRMVVIKFPIECETKKQKYAWYLAKICDVRERETRKKGKRIVLVEHLVRYEHDDVEEWLNLWEVTKQKKLQLLGVTITGDSREQGIAMNAIPEPNSGLNETTAREGDDAAGIGTDALP